MKGLYPPNLQHTAFSHVNLLAPDKLSSKPCSCCLGTLGDCSQCAHQPVDALVALSTGATVARCRTTSHGQRTVDDVTLALYFAYHDS